MMKIEEQLTGCPMKQGLQGPWLANEVHNLESEYIFWLEETLS
jgi:hypothetical protein